MKSPAIRRDAPARKAGKLYELTSLELKEVSNLKKYFPSNIAMLIATVTVAGQQPATYSSPTTSPRQQYTCVMHPEVVSHRPGKCPKCGMDLVAVKSKIIPQHVTHLREQNAH